MQVNALLEPLIASPGHCNLVKVLKKGAEPDEVRVFEQLLFHCVKRNLDVLEVAPLEQTGFLLSKGLFFVR